MNWKFWKRKPVDEPTNAYYLNISPDLRDGLNREMSRLAITPCPGWRARYVRGSCAIEVYKLIGGEPKKVKEGIEP